jgi:hypothetical protein
MLLAASAAREGGASTQKHVYVRYIMSMFVFKIYVRPNSIFVLCFVVECDKPRAMTTVLDTVV